MTEPGDVPEEERREVVEEEPPREPPPAFGKAMSGFMIGFAIVLAIIATGLFGFFQVIPAILAMGMAFVLAAIAAADLIAEKHREQSEGE